MSLPSVPTVIPPKKPKLFFYCDETSHNISGYMAVGGIAVRQTNIAKIKEEVQQICQSYGISTEVKWSHLKSGPKFTAYKAIVDYFFSLSESNQIHYHCIFADTTRFDYSAVANCSKNTMLPRMYYQLILHRFARYYGRACDLHVRPDKSNSLSDLSRWQVELNNSVARRYESRSPIKSIHLVDSKSCFLLQMNDLILGAMGYYKNSRHTMHNGAAAKREMAYYILGKTGLRNYDSNTDIKARKLTIWNFQSKHYRP